MFSQQNLLSYKQRKGEQESVKPITCNDTQWLVKPLEKNTDYSFKISIKGFIY